MSPRSPLAPLLLALGCPACLLPVPEAGLEVPPLQVEVLTAQGDPAPQAEVIVRRLIYAPGPITETSRRTRATDEQGQVEFAPEPTTDITMPLMIHGRPALRFELCAQQPGQGAARVFLDASPRDRDAEPQRIRLTLDPMVDPCVGGSLSRRHRAAFD